MRVQVLGWLFVCWVALGMSPRALAQAPLDILGDTTDALTEDLDPDEAEIEARLARLEAMQGKRSSRVVVLKWPDTSVGHENLILKELVKNRIGRPSAKFYPAIDLYQEGRIRTVDHHREVRPANQPGSVPDSLLAEARSVIVNANRQMTRKEAYPQIAGELSLWVDEIWFADRPEVREVLFDLYLTIGRAMFYSQNQNPPYYRIIGGRNVTYYLYLAAAMLLEEQDLEERPLFDRLGDGKPDQMVRKLLAELQDGYHKLLPLAFHDQGFFKARKFAKEYALYVNGLERTVDDTGVMMVPRGRIDIYLRRNSDGFSMSERLEVARLDDKIYFVVETARQKMGYALLNTLMMDPAECSRFLDDQTVASLAAYAAMHPKDEIYLAVPRAGSVHDLYIWRFERGGRGVDPHLKLMQDRTGGFPVRFAVLATTGMIFNGATVGGDDYASLVGDTSDPFAAAQEPSLPSFEDATTSAFDLQAAAVPIDFQFRGHFNRLMFGFGMQIATNITGEGVGGDEDNQGKWTEVYQTNPGSNHVVVEPEDPTQVSAGGPQPAFNVQEWQRLLYVHLGVMLLKDAPYGTGPRGYVRFGWYNAPHAFDLTGHIGITEEPTFGKKEYKGRVMPIVDVDFYAGMMVPFGKSLYCSDYANGRCVPRVLPVLGMSLGAGVTF